LIVAAWGAGRYREGWVSVCPETEEIPMIAKSFFVVALILVSPPAALAQDTAGAAYKAANDKMMQGMMKPMSGDADKDFVMMMIAHHQGAIDMAKVELKFGKDKMLRAMAERIIKAQEKEIAEMKKWQAAHP
jgi:hypothetical protein